MDDAFIAIHFSLELLKKYLKTVARYSLRLSFDISIFLRHLPMYSTAQSRSIETRKNSNRKKMGHTFKERSLLLKTTLDVRA